MDAIREYLIGVCAAALLCGIVTGLSGKTGMMGPSMKLMTGIFMAVAVVAPLLNVRIQALAEITTDFTEDAAAITASGENSSRQAMAQIIKSEAEAYILDKAKSMNVDLGVQITLDDSDIPVPVSVKLTGSISPYAKKLLTNMITEELGIPVEEQQWN